MSSCGLPWPAGLVHEDFAARYSDSKPFEFGQMPGVISATAKFPLGDRGYWKLTRLGFSNMPLSN
ncbi:hypothetical protein CLIM01_04114 [Colletotrichum limetticola]|uniref:Uncharacterized protein n=1 Tax=Colletotrichum limetticola TaxID=1209924 RepID=A0ABQ9Q497_9PEZI|nr:hypothetical protein CLIM01_04114 [Colletotrichum limetticola]